MGDGIIMDISNPVAPKVIEQVTDTENFAFWHSATFNAKGTKVVFTDEPGTRRIVWLFSMVLGYSRLIWARFAMHQDLTTVLRCHVAAFQALGTLMAVGLMMLPAAAARFWAREVWSLAAVAAGLAGAAGYLGLVVSFHLDAPSGPAIVLVAGAGYLLSLLAGRRGGLLRRWFAAPHLEA